MEEEKNIPQEEKEPEEPVIESVIEKEPEEEKSTEEETPTEESSSEEKTEEKEETSKEESEVKEEVSSEEPKEEKTPKEKKSLKEILGKKKKPIIIGVLLVVIIAILFSLLKSILTPQEFEVVNIAKESKGNYVANNEEFTVETKGGSLDQVKKHIYIEPAVNYKVTKKSKNKYKVVAKDIPSNEIVNLEFIDNKVVEDKWAFQSTKELTVTSVYPANNTTNISTNSTIEITFSYPDVEDINKSVVIEPKVEGTFEQNGRIWVLKPKKPLKDDETYTITIKDDIKTGDKKLSEGLKTTFSTHNDTNKTISYDSITLDGIETFKTTEKPMFITKEKITKVEMQKFNSSEDFRKYISNETGYKLKSLGNVSIKKLNHDLYTLEKTYEKGYYLLKAFDSKGKLCFSIPIQVNNLQAYLMTTQNDLLVWTGSNNSVQKNVNISYEKTNVKTDKDGLAIIKKYNDKKNKLKYVKVGKDNPIFVGVNNADNEEYPNGYIYTDRPLYKNTDDVNIFGYIPFKYFENGASKNDFVVSIDDTKLPVEINDDGTFTTKYHLDNMKSDYMSVTLKYKDSYIASRYFEVKEYEKEMYDFKIIMDKNYVYAGQDFRFKVKVTHISGVTVPNKTIQIIVDDDRTIYTKTNANGIAEFSLDTAREESPTSIWHSESITVKSTLTESAQEGYGFSYYVIDRLLDESNSDFDIKTKMFTVDINTLSTNKNVKNIDWDMSEIVDKPYNGTATVEIEETKITRTISGYEYNEITKENVPEYDFDSDTNIVKTDTYTINNGKVNYKVDYDFKKDSEDITYLYGMTLTMNDSRKQKTEFEFYLYDEEDYESNMDGYSGYDRNPVSSNYYNLYNYYMPTGDETVYSVNSKIIRSLYSYNGQKEVTNNKFLLIKYKNNIIDKKIVNSTEKISTTFNDSDRPGIRITGAYLKNGNFYRLPTEYLDYNEEDSELNIEIKPDKTTYKPQEEATVNIKVTKKDKGIKSKVNVSVVDEGVFKAVSDTTNILEQLYYDMWYTQYTFSTYRDYNLYIEGGGMGSTGGGARTDFGDTIFFKTVETDGSGNAQVKFKMNDSITSFRITAHATTTDVDAGSNHTNIESSIPLSITFNKPLGQKETDDVVLNAIGIGSSNTNVNFEFSIKGIDKKITKTARMSNNVYANFGKLPAGTYTAVISAQSGSDSDKVEFKFNVVKTQTEVSVKTTKSIKEQNNIKPTKNPIKLEFYRASFESYEKYLDILKDTNENRLDTKFTYNKALEFENKYNDKNYILDLGDIHKFKTKTGYKYLAGDEDVSYELTAILSYYDNSLAINKSVFYKLLKSKDIAVRLNGYMNLAAQKEPILDDLNTISKIENDDLLFKLALSYVFLGDYNSARKQYDKMKDSGKRAYLSTFIDKKEAEKLIDQVYAKEHANRYVYLAMISYFENNNAGLASKEKVTVSYGKKKEEVTLSSLGKKYLTISQKDLKALKFTSKYKDIYISYYYDGLLEEIDDSKKVQNITCKILNNKIALGTNAILQVDIKNVAPNTNLDLYLPNGFTLGDTFKSNFAYIVASTKEHVTINVGDKKSTMLYIPLYASSPGNYTIEPIVLKNDDKYQISNSVTVNISQ